MIRIGPITEYKEDVLDEFGPKEEDLEEWVLVDALALAWRKIDQLNNKIESLEKGHQI